MADRALGMVETRGLVASIEAADAMLKAARVKLLKKEKVTAGLVTILVVGETAAVKSAVDAGAAAAQRIGELVSTHIIPRPDEQIDDLLSKVNEVDVTDKKETQKKPPEKKAEPKTRAKKLKTKEPENEEVESEKEDVIEVPKKSSFSTIDRLKQEALGETSTPEKSLKSKTSKTGFSMAELEVMNVHQLRRFARDIEEFPIKGREISRANRGELLDYFKALLK